MTFTHLTAARQHAPVVATFRTQCKSFTVKLQTRSDGDESFEPDGE